MIRGIRKKEHFYSAENLPSYKFLSILLRFVLVSLFAVASLVLIVFITSRDYSLVNVPFKYYALIIGLYLALTELQIIIDNILESFFPVPRRLYLRLSIQLVIGVLTILMAVFIVTNTIEKQLENPDATPGMYLAVTIALFVIYTVANMLILIRLSRKWMSSQVHIEKLKQEKLSMDYNLLQDQLNPHFLFNNLSVLKSLIIYDTKTAVKFTENFTDVYRYVLQSKKKILVSLKTELEFLKSYVALHKERIGDGLNVEFEVDENSMQKEIAPLSIQLLIENAIKHNVCSKDQPLNILILSDEIDLIVSNNIQLKDASYSTKTGLKNLIERYNYLTEKGVEVLQTKTEFKVKIPLI